MACGALSGARAWDYLWRKRRKLPAVVRIRLKSGTWIAGLYGSVEGRGDSYAAGYPEDGDLFLTVALKINPITGALVATTTDRSQSTEGRACSYDGMKSSISTSWRQ